MSRRGTALAAGLVLSALMAPTATADGVDDLPPVAEQELADSIYDIELSLTGITTHIGDMERSEDSSDRVVLDSDILFGFDEATLSPAATKAIGEVVADIPDGASVTIAGYTDDVGEDTYNQTLSTQRAEAVQKAIAKARPDLGLTAEGHGSVDPVASNSEPEGRAKNRRVEITVD